VLAHFFLLVVAFALRVFGLGLRVRFAFGAVRFFPVHARVTVVVVCFAGIIDSYSATGRYIGRLVLGRH
jgi:hypothetical protein